MAKIRRYLRRNEKQTVKITRYEWPSLINKDISNRYTVAIRIEFHTFPEIPERYSSTDKYENFDKAHMEAAECMPTKPEPNVEFHGSYKYL